MKQPNEGITGEFHYQCVICGEMFWADSVLFMDHVHCPECFEDYLRENKVNLEIEAEFNEWAEKESRKPNQKTSPT